MAICSQMLDTCILYMYVWYVGMYVCIKTLILCNEEVKNPQVHPSVLLLVPLLPLALCGHERGRSSFDSIVLMALDVS